MVYFYVTFNPGIYDVSLIVIYGLLTVFRLDLFLHVHLSKPRSTYPSGMMRNTIAARAPIICTPFRWLH